jgi:putative ABC transport system substrate-binding protein
MKRIAVVHPTVSPEIMNEKSGDLIYRGLFTELHRLGYVEGKNLIVERRSGEGRTERYAEIARELVNLKPDLMVVASARILAFFREATTTIPIIAITGDPILFGIVSNVSRPEGNITGFSADASVEIHGKYLEILKEMKPDLSICRKRSLSPTFFVLI